MSHKQQFDRLFNFRALPDHPVPKDLRETLGHRGQQVHQENRYSQMEQN